MLYFVTQIKYAHEQTAIRHNMTNAIILVSLKAFLILTMTSQNNKLNAIILANPSLVIKITPFDPWTADATKTIIFFVTKVHTKHSIIIYTRIVARLLVFIPHF